MVWTRCGTLPVFVRPRLSALNPFPSFYTRFESSTSKDRPRHFTRWRETQRDVRLESRVQRDVLGPTPGPTPLLLSCSVTLSLALWEQTVTQLHPAAAGDEGDGGDGETGGRVSITVADIDSLWTRFNSIPFRLSHRGAVMRRGDLDNPG